MNKRASTVEMCCVMLLLFLFGASTCAMFVAGYESFGRMNKLQDDCLNTRVAMNYVSMHIRRADVSRAVRVEDSTLGTILTLSEDIEGESYETRIYLHNGYLKESFVSAETPFDEEYGFEIIQLDSFGIRRENNMIVIEISRGVDKRSMKLALRAGVDV